MDSVDSTIEKIKNDEVNKERLLKEKRELEATRASINKSIRDTVALTEKSSLQQLELTRSIKKLRKQLQIEKLRQKSVTSLLNTSLKELEDLRHKSNVGISNVWDLRSSLCAETYTTFSCYDIWALLKKPTPTDPPISRMSNSFNESIITDTENRVKAANERRLKATAERDRLLLEPENGVEFLRIKNALKYSLERITDLKK
ncbi:uncharacterized protein LOC116776220 [Danaus plexippus]|uniref:uncharacterized protein LOC116776220 n=1 Tax=Danaus plexippus TaxID=13037 RepID=UPI002AB0150F|nr:uncharacterized protein LOC116776220 [Danaus plexippus]